MNWKRRRKSSSRSSFSLKQTQGQRQQIVEVHRVRCQLLVHVARLDVLDLRQQFRVIGIPGFQDFLDPLTGILRERKNIRQHHRFGKAECLGVDRRIRDHPGQQVLLVLAVEDRIATTKPEPVPVLAQDPVPNRVKGSTQSRRISIGSRFSTRSSISRAALLVKVSRRMFSGAIRSPEGKRPGRSGSGSSRFRPPR